MDSGLCKQQSEWTGLAVFGQLVLTVTFPREAAVLGADLCYKLFLSIRQYNVRHVLILRQRPPALDLAGIVQRMPTA